MKLIRSIEEAQSLAGQELGVSDWLAIDQQRVNSFADVTGDHQWIHVDVERAKAESPYKTPIAHGFLTLSEHAEVLYKTTDFWSRSCERALRWDDPDLAIGWPQLGSAPLLSERDGAAPLLAELGAADLFD